jgi:hypothetical protein
LLVCRLRSGWMTMSSRRSSRRTRRSKCTEPLYCIGLAWLVLLLLLACSAYSVCKCICCAVAYGLLLCLCVPLVWQVRRDHNAFELVHCC